MKFLLIFTLLGLGLSGCGNPTTSQSNRGTTAPALAPAAPVGSPAHDEAIDEATGKTPFIPKDGKYPGHGKVTRINTQLGSIEIDHEAIPDMMPAMKMEFYVNDKGLLDGLKAGDAVDFVLEYKHPTETIISIKKAK